jgi:hypothetical protein
MAVIRATCTDCGDVELRSRDLFLRRCRDTGAATYHFRCPACTMVEVRPAEPKVVEVLRAAGVACTEWDLPAELLEPHHGSLITHDDVLDFHELLSSPTWFRALGSITDR